MLKITIDNSNASNWKVTTFYGPFMYSNNTALWIATILLLLCEKCSMTICAKLFCKPNCD